MDLFYIFALVAAAIQSFRYGHHLALPLFTGSILASIVFELLYQPFSRSWLRDWYALLLTPLLAARVLAGIEAFWRHARRYSYRRELATAAGLLALIFALIVAWRFNAIDAVHTAVQLRRVVIVGLAAFLGIYALLMWSVGLWRDSFASAHLFLLFLLCFVMSVSVILRMAYPVGVWHAVNPIAYGMSAIIYLGWSWLFSQTRPAGRRAS